MFIIDKNMYRNKDYSVLARFFVVTYWMLPFTE